MNITCDPPRCLVTGANGRLGLLLQAAWLAEPDIAPILCARRTPADIVWSPGQPVPALPPCETVIALWGRTDGDADTLGLNRDLVFEGLRLAQACGAGRIFHLSSAAIYGPGTWMPETRSPAPANAYGAAKRDMEGTIEALPPEGPRHVILRLANVVGADSLGAALHDHTHPVTLDRFADGTGPRRSYIAPGDLARVLSALARLPVHRVPDILNVAAPEPVAMVNLARAAGRPVVWRDAPPGAQPCVSLDTGRLGRVLPGVIRCTTPEAMIADWRGLAPAR